MGNGRRMGRRLGKALGALFILVLAGTVLLATAARHSHKNTAELSLSPASSSGKVSQHTKPNANTILGELPLIFEPNQGQADSKIKFLARGSGYSIFLDATGATLALQSGSRPEAKIRSGVRANIRDQFFSMKLVGANLSSATSGTEPLPGKSNYILGNDPRRWHSGIPQFAGVHYASVYPGIDLVFYGNQGRLEYDFKVAPGADASQPEMQFSGAKGLKLSDGNLILTGANVRGLRLHAPEIYQRNGDRREPVAGRFILRAGNRVGLEIGAYDHSRELIIDPRLEFSSYFGGNGAITSPSLAVNGNGNIYLTGTTTSTAGFPAASTTVGLASGASAVFVAEINPSQPPSVAYLTFIGGSGTDSSVGIGVDNGGRAYIAGNTTSTNFPTSNTSVSGYQTGPEAKGTQCANITCSSVFVAVLNSSGAAPLQYSSYLSGNGNDVASSMTIDASGDVFVTGTTTSNDVPSISPADDFPATYLPTPFQSQPVSSPQFFVTKVNTGIDGPGGIAYSTYFGGGASPGGTSATGGGIAVDSNGNIYFSGTTNFFNSGSGQYGASGQSTDFPILNAYQPCLNTPPPITIGVSNQCSATGFTTPYPTDAFVAKLNPNAAVGSQLLFSTYLGAENNDSSTALALDTGAANIYVTGSTNSTNFVLPTGSGAFQTCLNNTNIPNPIPATTACTSGGTTNSDAYVARFGNPTLSTTGTPNLVPLTYFSYLGGSGNDSGLAIAVLNSTTTTLGDISVTGSTNSVNFPLSSDAIQTTLGTGATGNAFLAQINTTTAAGANQSGSYATYFGGSGLDRGTSIAVDSNQNTYIAGDTTSNNLQLINPLPNAGGSTFSGTQDAFVLKLGSTTTLCITCIAPTVSTSGTVSAGTAVTVTFTVENEGPDPATNVIVTGSSSSGMVLDSATAGSGTCSTATGNSSVCTIPALQAGATATVAFSVTPSAKGNYTVTALVSDTNNINTVNSAQQSITAGGFNFSVSPPARSVSAGTTATYSLLLNPNPVFGVQVSLSCGSLPGGAACNFAPSNAVTLNGPVSVTLNLTTTAQPVNTASAGALRPLSALWLAIPGMAVLGLGTRGKRGKAKLSRVLGLLSLSVLFALVLLQPSCSSGKTQPTVSGTPTGTYSLTVTATSGTLSQSQPISLTVTP